MNSNIIGMQEVCNIPMLGLMAGIISVSENPCFFFPQGFLASERLIFVLTEVLQQC